MNSRVLTQATIPAETETEGSSAPMRHLGRPLKRDVPMSSGERNMRRIARMAATEIAAAATVEQLWEIHRELTAAGLSDWAYQIASVLRKNALSVAAEYARRNSAYFVRGGPSMLSPEETAHRQHAISRLADEIDKLTDGGGADRASYQRFEGILSELRGLGFWIEGALVSAVARAFALG